jgi:hypothetical protein
MMSISAILSLREEAAQRARRRQDQPRVFFDAQDVETHFSRVPNLGDYRPKGWKLVEHRLVDKTGWDPEDAGGPALSLNAFKRWLSEHVADESGFAIIEEGQFQVVVGRFAQKKAKARRAS